MPIISRIGARSWKVRGLYAGIFLVLSLGSVTMIYPFMLMVAGSFSSQVDSEGLGIYPGFWFDDDVLYQKYVESRYAQMILTEQTHAIEYRSWLKIAPVDQLDADVQVAALDREWVDAYRDYRDQVAWPTGWYYIAQGQSDRFVRLHARQFRQQMADRFGGDLTKLNNHYGIGFVSWEMVRLTATPQQHSRRYRSGLDWPKNSLQRAILDYKASVPKIDRVPVNIDGFFWHTFLKTLYTSIEKYNDAHGTTHADYRQVVLSSRAPPDGKGREDWEIFVREELNLGFIRVDDPSVTSGFGRFLAESGQYSDIAEYNRIHGKIDKDKDGKEKEFASFDAILFPERLPTSRRAQEDLSTFIVDREACPLEALQVYGPRQDFLKWLEEEGKLHVFSDAHMRPLPLAEADHADMKANRSAIRWEETRRNYLHVIEYILVRGKAVRNTIIYCGLLIAATLLVNPLAAYALSRYRPPSQYKVLLICMATMAFPGEVTMIPAFLMLKKFPFWNLVVGVSVTGTILYLGIKFRPKSSETFLGLTSMVMGILAGWYLAPHVAALFTGSKTPHISLLNTFAALVLPSMANGYGLFLLKGFFDSLPRELYESADIDGAGEWTKFWSLTMNLSKPILAVLALGAFTAAYSEFMMALIIIPERDMWTLMVWVFQLQMSAAQPVILTSVLLTAIPTFVVFIFCQNIIIRGIVVPVEK